MSSTQFKADPTGSGEWDNYGGPQTDVSVLNLCRRSISMWIQQVTENRTTMVDLKQTLLKVKSKTTVDVKFSRKEHSARVSSLLRVFEQYERQLEGQVRQQTDAIWQNQTTAVGSRRCYTCGIALGRQLSLSRDEMRRHLLPPRDSFKPPGGPWQNSNL